MNQSGSVLRWYLKNMVDMKDGEMECGDVSNNVY